MDPNGLFVFCLLSFLSCGLLELGFACLFDIEQCEDGEVSGDAAPLVDFIIFVGLVVIGGVTLKFSRSGIRSLGPSGQTSIINVIFRLLLRSCTAPVTKSASRSKLKLRSSFEQP